MADNPKAADKRRDDTMGSFLVTGMIGTAMLIAIPPFLCGYYSPWSGGSSYEVDGVTSLHTTWRQTAYADAT